MPATIRIIILLVICLVLFIAELVTGPVQIPLSDVVDVLLAKSPTDNAWDTIVNETRMPRALAATLAGIALAWSGWLMQTLFRNPLAGPSVLGISSGASLGVALLMLISGGVSFGMFGSAAIALSAVTGSFLVLLLVMIVARKLADNTSLLVFGIMLGYLTSAIVSALQFKASSDMVKAYVLWGLGSYAEADLFEISLMTIVVPVGGIMILLLLKPLNLLLLGEEYAQSMGVNVKATRTWLIICVGLLAGCITAFCGPVAFIGMVVPHVARTWMNTSSHQKLYLPVALAGAAVSLGSDLLSRHLELPLNAVMSAIGAPIVIYVIIRGSKAKAII